MSRTSITDAYRAMVHETIASHRDLDLKALKQALKSRDPGGSSYQRRTWSAVCIRMLRLYGFMPNRKGNDGSVQLLMHANKLQDGI
jgi:hypothetical protein